jgi:enediyne biosynthesis protein E4
LLKQSVNPPGHWVILKLTGTRSNRSGIGARVKLIANGRGQFGEVRSGGSYLSQNDLRLHFGLASTAQIDRIEILWPSGARQVLKNQPCDRVLSIREEP